MARRTNSATEIPSDCASSRARAYSCLSRLIWVRITLSPTEIIITYPPLPDRSLVLLRASDQGAHARTGQDNSRQIQWVGIRNVEVVLSAWIGAADGAQQVQRFGARELFAGEAGNEAATSDFALRFFLAQHQQQIAPGRRQRFARQQVAKNDTPALQQLIRESRCACVISQCGRSVSHHCPTAGSVPRPGVLAAALATPALWIHQRTQILETIRRHQACCNQFPKSVLYFAGKAARGADQIVEETSAAAL